MTSGGTMTVCGKSQNDIICFFRITVHPAIAGHVDSFV